MAEETVALLEQVWGTTAELCAGLTEDDWKAETGLPGWTVQDHVSHLIGTERMLLSGEQPPDIDVSHHDHVTNPIAEFNERWVEARRDQDGATVLSEFRRVTADRTQQLSAMSAEEFDQVGFTPEGEAPYREFMSIRVFDCWVHEQDIRRALDRPGNLSGPAAEHSLDRVVKAMGYVVGKKAGAPDGSSVVLAITGVTERTVPIVVDGRAAVVEHAPDDLTCRMTLDVSTFVALGTGRDMGVDPLENGLVSVEGDAQLGRAIVDNLAFTI